MMTSRKTAVRPSPRPAPAPRRASRPALVALLLLAGWGLGPPGAAAPAARFGTVQSDLGGGLVAVLDQDHRLYLDAAPFPGEGLLAFCRRLTGGEEAAAEIARLNGGETRLQAGIRYRLPYERLRPELQVRLMRALFRDDEPADDGWQHTVRGVGPLGRESLWHLATWFTGRGENFAAIRAANDLSGEELSPGQVVTIPHDLLLPAFRGGYQVPAAAQGPAAAPEPASVDGAGPPAAVPAVERRLPEAGEAWGLEYRRDGSGEVAVYRLRPGEALYSSVVVRFTGRVIATDVNALAHEIADLSGIRDVTDIPVGYEIKVPMDLLLPEFLPSGHPRRREYEQSLAASSVYSNAVRTRDLAGITVILDAGHGGVDVGASTGGVWESLYVYDVTLRVKRILEAETGARVFVTTRDGDRWEIPERDVLPFSRGHAVLTDPPYPIQDSAVGVNLRWYLANSLFRRAVAGPADPDEVVFLSLHGDSLHPSLRGMMAYIPGAGLIGDGFGKSGTVYASRREVRERPRVEFSWQQRVKSEGLSRQLAERVVGAFHQHGLPVHPFKPVREKVIRRRGQEWVPAVLRYNEVPAKALIEIVNLANDQDRRLIQTREYRERIARAVVDGVRQYYGEDGGAPRGVVTAAAR